MTVDSSLEDVFSAYSFAVDKHLPENGGDPKTFKFYSDAYKLAALHKACPMHGLQGEPLHAPLVKHKDGTIGMRVRMAAGGFPDLPFFRCSSVVLPLCFRSSSVVFASSLLLFLQL